MNKSFFFLASKKTHFWQLFISQIYNIIIQCHMNLNESASDTNRMCSVAKFVQVCFNVRSANVKYIQPERLDLWAQTCYTSEQNLIQKYLHTSQKSRLLCCDIF